MAGIRKRTTTRRNFSIAQEAERLGRKHMSVTVSAPRGFNRVFPIAFAAPKRMGGTTLIGKITVGKGKERATTYWHSDRRTREGRIVDRGK